MRVKDHLAIGLLTEPKVRGHARSSEAPAKFMAEASNYQAPCTKCHVQSWCFWLFSRTKLASVHASCSCEASGSGFDGSSSHFCLGFQRTKAQPSPRVIQMPFVAPFEAPGTRHQAHPASPSIEPHVVSPGENHAGLLLRQELPDGLARVLASNRRATAHGTKGQSWPNWVCLFGGWTPQNGWCPLGFPLEPTKEGTLQKQHTQSSEDGKLHKTSRLRLYSVPLRIVPSHLC